MKKVDGLRSKIVHGSPIVTKSNSRPLDILPDLRETKGLGVLVANGRADAFAMPLTKLRMPDMHEDVSYAGSMFSNFDIYDGEYEQFQWDVHIPIKGTLHAGIWFLDSEAKTELAKIEDWMKKPASDEYRHHLRS